MLNEILHDDDDPSSRQVPAPTPEEAAAAAAAARDLDLFGLKPCFTPEIELACQEVANWVRCDNPGGYIHGLQRLGKSWCARYIHQAVPMILGGSTIAVLWSADDLKQSRIEFLRDRLRQLKHPGFNHRFATTLSQRLNDHLVQLAGMSRATRILLIMDEAHKMSEAHYHQMVQITDALVVEGIRSFFLQVGQQELKTHAATFVLKTATQLTGRFFPVSHEFLGISLAALKSLLVSMDGEAGYSVVERFLPERAAKDWRLSSMAESMSAAIQSLAPPGIEKECIRLPMQYARSALSNLIYRLREPAGYSIEVDEALLADCLREVGFSDVIGLYAMRNEPDATVH
jgi:hypothetical protein